jgi:hypothetical protein
VANKISDRLAMASRKAFSAPAPVSMAAPMQIGAYFDVLANHRRIRRRHDGLNPGRIVWKIVHFPIYVPVHYFVCPYIYQLFQCIMLFHVKH